MLSGIIGILVIVTAAILSHFFLPHDNIIEETVESIIEEHTGLDIDLSPDDDEEFIQIERTYNEKTGEVEIKETRMKY